MNKDNELLPWEHAVFRKLLGLAWPIILSSLSFNLMTLVNALLISHSGTAQLAGVGFGGVLGFMLLSFIYGVLRAAKTLVSHCVGAGAKERIPNYQGAALTLALIGGFLCLAVAELVALVVPYITASAEAGLMTQRYLAIGMLAAPVMVWNTALREVCFGEGDSRTPMIATVASNLTNIAAAAFLLFVLKLGVAGAAIATMCAHAVDCLILTRAQYRRHGLVNIGRSGDLAEVWKLGLPCGLQFSLEVGAMTLLAGLIAGLGENAMAANQIASNIVQFCLLPVAAIAESGAVLAGQAMGANKHRLVMKLARLSLACACSYTIVCACAMALAPDMVSGFFCSDGELVGACRSVLVMAALFVIIDATNMVARSILRSVGDLRIPALVGVITAWALTPPATWLFAYRLDMGLFGSWLGMCLQTAAGAAVLWYRLKHTQWHSPDLARSEA